MSSPVFQAALERAAKTWKKYIVGICVLYLTLLIDGMSGFSFLRGDAPINLAGFKVVREALSATYGILFSVFMATAFLESRLLEAHAPPTALPGSEKPPALDLWFISPFSASRVLRKVFWLLFVAGFLLLAQFSFAHLALVSSPDPDRMSPAVYRVIGVVDLILLMLCIPFGFRIHRNLELVRSKLPGCAG